MYKYKELPEGLITLSDRACVLDVVLCVCLMYVERKG